MTKIFFGTNELIFTKNVVHGACCRKIYQNAKFTVIPSQWYP